MLVESLIRPIRPQTKVLSIVGFEQTLSHKSQNLSLAPWGSACLLPQTSSASLLLPCRRLLTHWVLCIGVNFSCSLLSRLARQIDFSKSIISIESIDSGSLRFLTELSDFESSTSRTLTTSAHVLVLDLTWPALFSSTLPPFLPFSALCPLGSFGYVLPLHLVIPRLADLLPFVHTSVASSAFLDPFTSLVELKSNLYS